MKPFDKRQGHLETFDLKIIVASAAIVLLPILDPFSILVNDERHGDMTDFREVVTPPLIWRFRPPLDRIDLHVEVPAVSLREPCSGPAERSEAVAARVAAARLIQQARFGATTSTPVNAAMGPEDLRRW